LEERLELVREQGKDHGLNRSLRALGVSKSTWYRHKKRSKVSQKDEELKAKVLKVVKGHPAYGYRRIKAELAARWG